MPTTFEQLEVILYPPPDPIPPPPPLGPITTDIVREVMDDTGAIAQEAQERALAAVDSMSAMALVLPPVSTPTIPVPTITTLPIGEQPTEPGDLEATFPVAPVEPALGAFADLTLPDQPEYDVTSPLLIDVDLPDPFSAGLPAPPTLNTVVAPAPFAETLPTAPTVVDVAAPEAFDGTLPATPVLNELSAPAAFAIPVPNAPSLDTLVPPAALSATVPEAPVIDVLEAPGAGTAVAPVVPTLAPLAEPAPFDTALPTAPTVTLPTPPTAFAGVLPTAPELLAVPVPSTLDLPVIDAPTLNPVVLPDEPSFALPAVPTLIGLNLPDVPVLDLPIFNETLGDKPDAPSGTFTWSEVEYNTTLLSNMNGRLIELIDGAHTGLSPAVEAALWQRGRDRQALLTQRAIEEANRLVAAKGFSMPQGTLVRLVQQAISEGMRNDADLSRDILIKQAELEQSNFQFSFNLAMQLESRLIEHFNQVQARALDAAKFAFQASIEIFNARVNLFNADVQAFGVKAQVFKTRLEGALAQLEVYKAQLEGQQLVGQLNVQATQIYTAQLEGVKTMAEVYRTRISAVQLRIEADKSQIEIYRARLEGQETLVKMKALDFEAYATQLKGEVTKVEMFSPLRSPSTTISRCSRACSSRTWSCSRPRSVPLKPRCARTASM